MNITDPIRRNAYAFPEKLALICNGQPLSFGALRTVMDRVATHLALAGVRAEEGVAVAIENPAGYLVTALATAHLGAVVTPFHIAKPASLRKELVSRHSIKWVVFDSSNAALRTDHPGLLPLQQVSIFAPLPTGCATAPVAHDVGNKPWIMALSSGTTGIPKSIPQSHDRAALTVTLTAGRTSSERLLICFDLSTGVGMNNALRQLYSGGTVVLNDIRNNFFNVVKRDRPDQAILSTGEALNLVKLAENAVPESRSACASLQSIVLSGSAVPPSLRRAIVDRVCSNIHVHYGATEAGGIANLAPEDSSRPGCAGRLHIWVEAEAVNEQDEPLPLGQMGVLRFRTPVLVKGYHNDKANTDRAFRNGWYYPGDLGSIDGAGYLYLAGPQDDLINIGGNKYDPSAIEAVINSLPDVIESAVVAASPSAEEPPRLVAVVATQTRLSPLVIAQTCLELLGKNAVPQGVIFMQSLPRNRGGKVIRSVVAKLARDAMTTTSTDSGTTP